MTSVDAYLAEVRRAMGGMDGAVRDDILRELRTHIAESLAANGGNVGVALAAIGAPSQVGRGYKELYGYGRAWRALFLAIAAALAIPSVPVLGALEEGLAPYSLSLPVLAGLVAWLLWVGARAGARVGLAAGLTAALARIAAVGVLALIEPGATTLAGGLALLLGTSAILIPLGWLPGTARRAWSGPKAEL